MQLDAALRRYSKKAGKFLETAGKRWSDAADSFGSGTYKSKNWIEDIKNTLAEVVDLSMTVLPISENPTLPVAFHDVKAANLPEAKPAFRVLIDEPVPLGTNPSLSEVVLEGDPSKSIPATVAVGAEADEIVVTLEVPKGKAPDMGFYHGFVKVKTEIVAMVLVHAH